MWDAAQKNRGRKAKAGLNDLPHSEYLLYSMIIDNTLFKDLLLLTKELLVGHTRKCSTEKSTTEKTRSSWFRKLIIRNTQPL